MPDGVVADAFLEAETAARSVCPTSAAVLVYWLPVAMGLAVQFAPP
jgi:hypothetical protein